MYQHDNNKALDFLDDHEHEVPCSDQNAGSTKTRRPQPGPRGVGVPLELDPLGFLTELLDGSPEKAKRLDDDFKRSKENTDSHIVEFCREFGIE